MVENQEQSFDNPNFILDRKEELFVSDDEWAKILPKELYEIARKKGTEKAWQGKFLANKKSGIYFCKVCGNTLFLSDSKFDSGCGWPSFFIPYKRNSVIYLDDYDHGMQRTEIQCSKCKSHLGHVFRDAPQTDTGLRYCLNSAVLHFKQVDDLKSFNFK